MTQPILLVNILYELGCIATFRGQEPKNEDEITVEWLDGKVGFSPRLEVHEGVLPAIKNIREAWKKAKDKADAELPKKEREQAYLKAWPPAQQLEALHDAANGNDAKLKQMNADFDAIKQDIPLS